jgi:hypothetical protein
MKVYETVYCYKRVYLWTKLSSFPPFPFVFLLVCFMASFTLYKFMLVRKRHKNQTFALWCYATTTLLIPRITDCNISMSNLS